MNSETKVISIIGIITVGIIILGMVLASGAAQRNAPPVALNQETLIRPENPRMTGANPKLQIVEFGDFECPACAATQPELKKFLTEFGDQVDFVFRVIPIHQNSKAAAAVAFAAHEQGKFKEMSDVLFENQEEWAKIGLSESGRTALFEKYASIVGLDIAKYKSDVVSKRSAYDAIVNQDERDATAMNVQVTPTFIINGETVLRGSQQYATFKALLDASSNPTVNPAGGTLPEGSPATTSPAV